jgi:hypothetical protein
VIFISEFDDKGKISDFNIEKKTEIFGGSYRNHFPPLPQRK